MRTSLLAMERGSNNVAPIDTAKEKEQSQRLILQTSASSSSTERQSSLSFFLNLAINAQLEMYNKRKRSRNICKYRFLQQLCIYILNSFQCNDILKEWQFFSNIFKYTFKLEYFKLFLFNIFFSTLITFVNKIDNHIINVKKKVQEIVCTSNTDTYIKKKKVQRLLIQFLYSLQNIFLVNLLFKSDLFQRIKNNKYY